MGRETDGGENGQRGQRGQQHEHKARMMPKCGGEGWAGGAKAMDEQGETLCYYAVLCVDSKYCFLQFD